jgi:hypothetical protein
VAEPYPPRDEALAIEWAIANGHYVKWVSVFDIDEGVGVVSRYFSNNEAIQRAVTVGVDSAISFLSIEAEEDAEQIAARHNAAFLARYPQYRGQTHAVRPNWGLWAAAVHNRSGYKTDSEAIAYLLETMETVLTRLDALENP